MFGNSSKALEAHDVDMIEDNEDADDDEYVTEEEFIQGTSHLSKRGGTKFAFF
jgi:hypothetical protein